MKKTFLTMISIFIALLFVFPVYAEESAVYDTVRDYIISAYSTGTSITIEVYDTSYNLIPNGDITDGNPVTVSSTAASTSFSLAYNPSSATAYILYDESGPSPVPTLATADLSSTTPPGPPVINVNPTTLNFGTIDVGSSTTLNVTVTNVGETDLNIGTVTNPSGPYSNVADTCSNTTIAPSGPSCTITTQFAPTSAGSYNGYSFQIPSNDSGSPATVTLNGTGQQTGGGDVDLYFTYLQARAPYPTYIYTCDNKTFDYTIRNSGSDDSGQVTMRIYLSLEDMVISGDDVLLGTKTFTNIRAGTSKVKAYTVTNPCNLMVHRIYFYIFVADEDNNVPETNENNNEIAVGATVKR